MIDDFAASHLCRWAKSRPHLAALIYNLVAMSPIGKMNMAPVHNGKFGLERPNLTESVLHKEAGIAVEGFHFIVIGPGDLPELHLLRSEPGLVLVYAFENDLHIYSGLGCPLRSVP